MSRRSCYFSGLLLIAMSCAMAAEPARPTIEPALRDPFFLAPVPVPVVKTPPAPAIVAPQPPPPASLPPPLNLRFVGRVISPDGAITVLAAVGETQLTLQLGQTLPNGYRVSAIEGNAITLIHPAFNIPTRFDVPEPPKYEVR